MAVQDTMERQINIFEEPIRMSQVSDPMDFTPHCEIINIDAMERQMNDEYLLRLKTLFEFFSGNIGTLAGLMDEPEVDEPTIVENKPAE